MSKAHDTNPRTCCDGNPHPQIGASFQQARRISDNTLQNVWLPSSLVGGGPADWRFYNYHDRTCYKIAFADLPSGSSGFVPDRIRPLSSDSDVLATCGTVLPCSLQGRLGSLGTGDMTITSAHELAVFLDCPGIGVPSGGPSSPGGLTLTESIQPQARCVGSYGLIFYGGMEFEYYIEFGQPDTSLDECSTGSPLYFISRIS